MKTVASAKASPRRRRKKKYPYKKVTVLWWDSYRDMEAVWHPPEEAEKETCPELEHTGYLIHENEDRIVLAQGVDKDDPSEVEGKFVIPRGCIRNIKEIK